MKLLFYCGHPAQYLFFRESIRKLTANGHHSLILIKTKDVLEALVKNDGLEYINILPQERGKSKFAIALSLIRRNIKILPVVIKYKPDILIGGDPSISQLGWLLRKKRFTLTEDDYPVIKTLARLTFPFAQAIVTPGINDVGKWEYKKVGYNGYMKLAYLHPGIFEPDNTIVAKYNINTPYALIRIAKLTAHHDFGMGGICPELLDKIVDALEKKGMEVYISAESDIPKKYYYRKLKINPSDMHQLLAGASILISDSQSMSVEASMLGIPSIRYSGFAGKISVLEELEHEYKLTSGIPHGNEDDFIKKLDELINTPNLRQEFQARRQIMLSEKIDVTAFMVWFIENYPDSIEIMQTNPDYQNRFK